MCVGRRLHFGEAMDNFQFGRRVNYCRTRRRLTRLEGGPPGRSAALGDAAGRAAAGHHAGQAAGRPRGPDRPTPPTRHERTSEKHAGESCIRLALRVSDSQRAPDPLPESPFGRGKGEMGGYVSRGDSAHTGACTPKREDPCLGGRGRSRARRNRASPKFEAPQASLGREVKSAARVVSPVLPRGPVGHCRACSHRCRALGLVAQLASRLSAS
jgi:hypothetical protein